MPTTITASLFALLICSTALASTLNVPQDFPTIQAAIDAAVAGDTVLVSSGTYVENISFRGKAITVKSASGPADTVIDGGSSDVTVRFDSNEGYLSVLKGFTVANGRSNNGGGIFCLSSSPTITDNVISGNSSEVVGGGILAIQASPYIANSRIVNNAATFGAGIFGDSGDPVIVNNIFARNSGQSGCGAYFGDFCFAAFTNNVLFGNHIVVEQGDGAGIRSQNPFLVVTNSIIWANTGEGGPQVSGCESSYCDVEGGAPGSGNLDADPLFANPAGGDFHLQPGSPCIDRGFNDVPGLPDMDFEGHPRILQGVVDMGADEFASCIIDFEEFGEGLSGSLGYIPRLSGVGGSCRAAESSIRIDDGLGGAPGVLFVGCCQADWYPFFGGHLYVDLGSVWTAIVIVLDGSKGWPGDGSQVLPIPSVEGYPAFTAYVQVAFLDSGAIQGVSLSNALTVESQK